METLENRYALATVFGLTSSDQLVQYDSASPTAISTPVAITNVTAGETLVGIDFRPQNGLLYGLGVNATANTGTLYAISTRTGVAGVVGTASSIALTTDGTTAVDLPDPATVGYGFDFNPAVDRIRVVAGGLNFRINPNTGTAVDGDNTGLTTGNVTGINPDGGTNGGTTTVDAAAYTNNQPNNGAITTLYTLDAATNALSIQNPPNPGTQVAVGGITLNGSPLDFTGVNGFDIPAGVNVASNNAGVTSGSGFAALTVGGTTRLYSINLVNGQATLLGNIGTGTTAIKGHSIQNDLGGISAIGLDGTGANLIRFNTATPGTTTTQAIAVASLASGEQLVGIDFRPQTGQLYGLAVNQAANTGTIYLIDPQTGALTAVGTPGQIAFTTDGTSPVDLPDPATAGYGFDFNPTVDRIRVTTSTGLSFRVNPNTGAAVDGDLGGAAGSVTGTNTDGIVNGNSVTGVSAAAYTNSFGQSLTGGTTTLYTLDAASNRLFIQNPPNASTQSSPLTVTLNGTTLDFTDVNGFDIPAGVRVATSNSSAAGFGFAALTVGGVTSVYRIDLQTAAATNLGAVGAGATGLAGLALADSPDVGTFQFSAPTYTVDESGTVATITVTRTGGSSGTATVSVATSDGTATSPADFADSDQVLTFGPGVTTQSFTIAIVNDGSVEGDETVNLALSNATGGASLGSQAAAVLTIVDDDTAPMQPPGSAVLVGDVLTVLGTSKSDSIVIKPVSGQVRVLLNGKNIGTFSPDEVGSVAVFAGAGNDSVVIATAFTFSTTLNGEAGNDTLVGGNGPDTMSGGLGKDTLVGNGGDDTLLGEEGNDVLNGGNGADSLSGGDGNDTLVGGSGNDEMFGDLGNDVVLGGSGDDSLDGGDGNDTLAGEGGNDTVFGGIGNDTLKGGAGNDVLSGGEGNDRLYGEAGIDFLLGDEGNDQLYGGAGRDVLVGGTGADKLYGEAGDDILIGGTTSADGDEATAAAVFDILNSNASYNARMQAILDLGVSAEEDDAVDTLFGGAGQDWFLIGTGDKVKDKAKNEIVA